MKPRKSSPFRSRRSITVALTAALIGHFAAPSARAAALTWDADSLTAAAQDGGGTWTTGQPNWRNTTSSTDNVSWTAGDAATFGAGVDAATYVVNLGGPIASAGMTFSNSGYILSAASAQTITNSGNVSVASGKSATIGQNVTVTRATAYSVTGGGTLNVTGMGAKLTTTNGSVITVGGGTKTVVGTGGVFEGKTSMVIGDNTANNTLEVNGGDVNISGTNANLVLANTTIAASSASITLASGSISNTATGGSVRFGIATANSISSTFHLNGGTLTVAKIFEGATGHSSTFNFNGGTLKVLSGSTSLANFMAVDTANVGAGGAKIDSNGTAVTIGQAFVTNATPDGGLTLNDTAVVKGSLTLTSSGSTYNGPTTITAGTLILSGAAALPSSPSISIASGATLDVSVQTTPTLAANQSLLGSGFVNGNLTTVATTKIYPNTDGTAGTLTFKSSLTLAAATTNQFDLSSSFIGANDKMVLDGTGAVLTPNGAQITIKSAGILDTTNDYVLIDLTGSGASIFGSFNANPVWAGVTPGSAANFSIVTESTKVKLRYTPPVGALTGVGLATPSSVTHGASPLLTVTVTPGSGPASTGIAVQADLSSIGGSAAQAFFDNGSNGDVTAGDNVFSYSYAIPGSVSFGVRSLAATVTDAQSRTAPASIGLTVSVANVTWGATPAGVNWGTGANWAGGASPGVADLVFFDASTQLAPNLETAYSVDSVTFNSGAGIYTLGGSTLTLTGSGVTNNSSSAQTLNVPVDMGFSQTINAASGDIALVGAVSGSSKSLTKTGSFVLTLSGANSYSGPTVINAGSLVLSGGGTLGDTTANLTLAGGGLNLGMTSQTVGAVSISAPSGSGDTIGNGSLTGTSYAASNTSGTAIISANLLANGSAGFAKTGSGVVTLSGNNTYTGTTAVSGGSVIALHANALGSTAGITTVVQSATLRLQGGLSYAAEGLSVASGGFNEPILQNVSDDNTWKGVITTTGAGSFARISSDSGLLTLANTITVSDASTSLVLQGAGNILVNGKITGTGRIFSGSVGAGIRTLTNTGNDFNGITTVSGGTLKLGASEVIPNGTGKGNVTMTGATATLDLASFSETLNGLSNTGTNGIVDNTVAATTSVLTVGDTDATSTFGGVIKNTAGTLALTKIGTGTLTLTGANTYSGNTTVTAGTLTLSNAPDPLNANTGNDASTVTIAATGATLNLTYTGTDLVDKLFFGAAQQPLGVYSATSVPAGATITTASFLGAGTLTVASSPSGSPYDTWATAKGLTGLPGSSTDPAKAADPDKDGQNNLSEFALDGNPLSGASDGKVVGKVATVSGSQVMTLTLPVRTGAIFTDSSGDELSALIDGIVYRIEGDVNLSTFSDNITEVTGGDATTIHTGLPSLSALPAPGWAYRTFRAPGTVPATPKAFLRAQISETP